MLIIHKNIQELLWLGWFYLCKWGSFLSFCTKYYEWIIGHHFFLIKKKKKTHGTKYKIRQQLETNVNFDCILTLI